MNQHTIHVGLRHHSLATLIRLALIVFVGLLLLSAPTQAKKTLSFDNSTNTNDNNSVDLKSAGTAIPYSTPEPGLIVQGDVCLNDSSGPGLPGVRIYRYFAIDPSALVATTDQSGYYTTSYTYIPHFETVTVWAQKEGYTLEPQQYYGAYVQGLQVWTLNFFARPLVADCPPPLPAPKRLLVYLWYPITLTATLNIGLGRDDDTTTAVITVTSEAGTVTKTGILGSLWSPSMSITVPLLPNTVHHPTVYGEFEYTPGCSYVTSTRYDFSGWPLTITSTGVGGVEPDVVSINGPATAPLGVSVDFTATASNTLGIASSEYCLEIESHPIYLPLILK